VTLSDVARLAGVSLATASKALNGRDQVKDTTRQRVIEAADRLSFSPNPLARGLLITDATVGLWKDSSGKVALEVTGQVEHQPLQMPALGMWETDDYSI